MSLTGQAGLQDKAAYANAKTILLEMGEFFQIQDDYLDCYGAPEVIGKIGTDIEDNKCGWLVVQALSRVSPAQRQVLEVRLSVSHSSDLICFVNFFVCNRALFYFIPCFKLKQSVSKTVLTGQDNYGKKNPDNVKTVKALYAELGLEQVHLKRSFCLCVCVCVCTCML